jgi:iron complex outermembrane receptor protein
MNGDGPAAQNRDIPTLGKFEIQIDEPGYSDAEWLSAVSETNIDVSFGDGVITNVFAWRNYKAGTLSDIDASPIIGFHAETYIDQEQFSNELRYAGTFGDLEITAGAYYFTQDINYVEDRLVAGGAVNLTGGGDQTYETLGLFSSADWNFAEEWTLNLGIRYTHEEKEAALADLVSGGCNLETLTCSVTFDEKNDWSAVTPKVGIRWAPDSDTLAYAFWTRGFRSGGYNFRNGPTTIPGPFDQEKQNSYELGLKKDFDNSTRVNVAAFYNEIQNLQREILFVGENNVTFQTIANAADAEIWGLEFEAQTYISSNFSLAANFGYIHDAYTNVFFDLNKDGQVNAADKDLHLPRVAPWSYGISGTYTQDIDGVGALRANLGFSHRDRQFYDDNNQGVLSPADMVNASISIASDDANWKFSIYGRNLLNDLTEGLNTSVPIFSPGSTFTTLNKGRVLGAELTFKY